MTTGMMIVEILSKNVYELYSRVDYGSDPCWPRWEC